jgi:hypothetical protein
MKSIRIVLISLCFALAMSCATNSGSLVSDYHGMRDGKKAYIVARNYLTTANSDGYEADINITNAYHNWVDSGGVIDLKNAKSSTPIVYSIQPGKYRIYSITERIPSSPLMNLLGNSGSTYIFDKPYPLAFVFDVKPGQIIYLGDFSFGDKEGRGQLDCGYDINKTKAALSAIEPSVEGYEWVDLRRDTPTWFREAEENSAKGK